ncbi:MAG: hypothetical protein Q8J68_09275 [Methanolobus sp.]|uniref:hypothetical protein n=1 Tax=Methanolobus sp. TaxID=1874737 RepID=UPI0027300DCD|nr:hypothetical protein [Methanolobus sp.]MDP2217464.1 hypothetical protein [Methanolobus sp.]
MDILQTIVSNGLYMYLKCSVVLVETINVMLMPFNLILVKKESNLPRELLTAYTTPHKRISEHAAECIIFSMDRGLQLHSLLSSYFEKVKNPVPVHVLYRTSSTSHQKAYYSLFSLFSEHPVTAVHQKDRDSFKKQLITILESIKAENVFFLVDDIVFTEDTDMFDFTKFDTRTAIVSLRLGANLKRAYTTQKDQKLPPFIPDAIQDSDKLCWTWESGELDWAYPLSVDGNLFLTQEMIVLAKNTDFNSPNTFEGNLQRYVHYFKHRYGVCYKKSKIINIPINKVQDDYKNIHGAIHQDYLLDQWNRGMQIDYRALYGFVNESAHQEIEISVVKRSDKMYADGT